MRKTLSNLFWPFLSGLAGTVFYAAGTFLWNNAPSSDDPRAVVGSFFTYIAASFWAMAILLLLALLLKRLSYRTADQMSGSGPPLLMRQPSVSGRTFHISIVIGIVFTITIVTTGLIVIQRFIDWEVLKGASPTMVSLADEAGMSPKGKLAFLRTHPQFVSDTQMEAACASNTAANNSNGFIEQGCFVPTENRIYIRKMPSDLHNLEISTAAYEMLHPVYLSLHRSSRGSALDAAIESNFAKIHDTNLDAQVANFAKTEPGARDLELFSLLATGYSHISSDLAVYYAPYFDNIGATLAANNQVFQLFKTDQEQLNQLQAQIKRYDSLANAAYGTSVRWAHAGDQSKDDFYYISYKQYIAQENMAVGQYNQLLQVYNALATEYNGIQPVQRIQPTQAISQ